MRDFLQVDAANVIAQITRLRTDFPDLNDDLQLLSDTLEGSTDFEHVMERITDAFLEAVSMKGAIADRMSSLQERGARFDRKADALRALALGLMKTAGQRSVTLPEASLSIRKGFRSVVLDDVSELPQGFVKTETVPLKTEIKKALEAGEIVPGAHLETGPDGLSVRTK